MNELEEKIMLIVCSRPGIRKREIADYLRMWHCSYDFMNAINSLEKDGVLRREAYSDPANMEYYDKWYVVAP